MQSLFESSHPHATSESVINLVDQLLKDATSNQVSDIHIEPNESQCRVRFRKDGLLYEAAIFPSSLATQIILRLKIMAELNIAEKRLPLDGRIHLAHLNLDIRLSTCPILYGEKIVLRLFNTKKNKLSIQQLGMNSAQHHLFLQKMHLPQGLVLVTGPTGSGKSMTLYAALEYLNHTNKNISTIEDPVELTLPGINQININPKIGLDFALSLRALLRQDPDILMIGEIRDLETAKMAIQAAQTGHLVFSTLHTNTAHETFSRLHSLGIHQTLINNSITLIIGQRLLRRLCVYCKTTNHTANERGCPYCQQGYHERTGIFELLNVTTGQFSCCMSLREAALEKIATGETTSTEVIRVLGSC